MNLKNYLIKKKENEMEKIKDLQDLKERAKDGWLNCRVVLNYSCFSRKYLWWFNDKFVVWNLIDDSTQELSPDELFDSGLTIIGDALNKSCLYAEKGF